MESRLGTATKHPDYDFDPTPVSATKPGTVERYREHERCLRHIAKLTVAIEKISAICNGRDHASIEADGRILPNGYMQIHLIARGVVPR